MHRQRVVVALASAYEDNVRIAAQKTLDIDPADVADVLRTALVLDESPDRPLITPHVIVQASAVSQIQIASSCDVGSNRTEGLTWKTSEGPGCIFVCDE